VGASSLSLDRRGDHDRPRLEADLGEFLDRVVGRMRSDAQKAGTAEDLAEIWRVLRSPEHSQRRAWRTAAMLGADWWTLGPQERARIERLCDEPMSRVLDSLLEATSLAELERSVAGARTVGEACSRTPDSSGGEWLKLRRTVESTRKELPAGTAPWDRGWAAARRLRAAVGHPQNKPASPEKLAAPLLVHSGEHDLTAVDSILAWSAGRSPVRFSRPARTRRGPGFAWARDLYPVLFEGAPDVEFAHVLSRQIAGSASVANAFAAEILAPIEAVRALLPSLHISSDDVAEIADELESPYHCVLHQIENHRLASIDREGTWFS